MTRTTIGAPSRASLDVRALPLRTLHVRTAQLRTVNIRTVNIRTLGLCALALCALGLGGCRSDGGVGRRDSQRSLRLTLDQIETQYDRDVAATDANFAKLSQWYSDEVSDPWSEVNRTVNLYLEGHAED